MTTLSNKRQAVSVVSPHHPYVRLYRAIILRAVQDLAEKQHRKEARKWLLSSESDYAFATAGMSPNGIRQQMTAHDGHAGREGQTVNSQK